LWCAVKQFKGSEEGMTRLKENTKTILPFIQGLNGVSKCLSTQIQKDKATLIRLFGENWVDVWRHNKILQQAIVDTFPTSQLALRALKMENSAAGPQGTPEEKPPGTALGGEAKRNHTQTKRMRRKSIRKKKLHIRPKTNKYKR
jgi:hypothetical protein